MPRYRIDGSFDRNAPDQQIQRRPPKEEEEQQKQKAKPPPPEKRRAEENLPWSWETDRALFHTHSSIPRYSPDYYEFQTFYRRYLVHSGKDTVWKDGSAGGGGGGGRRSAGAESSPTASATAATTTTTTTTTGGSSATTAAAGESATIIPEQQQKVQRAIELYHQFREKKRQTQVGKIQRERKQLPIQEYEQQIVDAVRRHPVTIIAADTGNSSGQISPSILTEKVPENPRKFRNTFWTLDSTGSLVHSPVVLHASPWQSESRMKRGMRTVHR